VAAFVAGLFAAAAVLTAVDVRVSGFDPAGSWWAVVPFALLLGTAEYLLVRFVYRREVNALNLFEAALAPVIVALPGAVVVLTVGVAQAGTAVVRRNNPLKACFNVGQWMVAAGAGSLVFTAARRGTTGLPAHDIPALLAALTVVSLCNQLAFAGVMRLVKGESWRATFAGLRPVILPGWVGGWAVNTAFGVLFAIAYTTTAWSLPFFFVPLVMLHWASRGFATARTDRLRLASLQRATHVLAAPIDPRDAIPGFLAEVLDGFEVDAVELVRIAAGSKWAFRMQRGADGPQDMEVVGVGGRITGALLELGRPVRVMPDTHPHLATLLAAEGRRDCAAAPMVVGDRVIGALCVFDRSGAEGFDDGELAVLQALAGEAADAFEKADLLASILEERRKLAAIVDNTSDGILAVDDTGVVQTWNPGLEAITGHPALTMVGNAHVGVLRARDHAGNDVLLERWADAETQLPTALQIAAADGTPRHLSCTYTRVPAQDDVRPLLVVMVRDVTRVHELERLKEDFVATVSHELRTPLTPIKGFANLLLEGAGRLDEEGRRTAAEAILRSAQRLERLIVNLLEVSRVESNVIDVRDSVVPLSSVVTRVVDEFRTAFPDRLIVVEPADGTTAAVGNELWIEQILSNLLSNAVKYAPTGAVEVEVRSVDDAVELTVTDHGPGVPPREAERIFRRFERLDHARQQAGTGLGLYIARELAQAMQGTLAVGTGPGGGAVFALRLPAARRPAAVA
jgi:PAS domain S-box-containing protein